MKGGAAGLHLPHVEQMVASEPALAESLGLNQKALEVVTIYREYADFLWRSLQHLGIRDADLEDVMQEVLVVVHKRRQSFNFECRLTTWLFGICLRVASRHRRRAYFRWERNEAELPERVDESTPEAELAERQAQASLARHLGQLNVEQRATFVMFEIEGHSCQEIANLFDVPINTVYSRLHTARRLVQAALNRERTRATGGAR